MTDIHLTPMESELLGVMGDLTLGDHPIMIEHKIRYHAVRTLHPNWGGGRRTARDGSRYYPLISLFLGRLRSKGLVERFDSSSAQTEGYTYGRWALTDLGRELCGISPSSDTVVV